MIPTSFSLSPSRAAFYCLDELILSLSFYVSLHRSPLLKLSRLSPSRSVSTLYELAPFFCLLHLSIRVSLSFCLCLSLSVSSSVSVIPRLITCCWHFELSHTFLGSWSHSWQPSALFCHLSWGISCTHRLCLSAVPLPGTAHKTPSCKENNSTCLLCYKVCLWQGAHRHDIQWIENQCTPFQSYSYVFWGSSPQGWHTWMWRSSPTV